MLLYVAGWLLVAVYGGVIVWSALGHHYKTMMIAVAALLVLTPVLLKYMQVNRESNQRATDQ